MKTDAKAIGECRTCRTPINGHGPAVIPRPIYRRIDATRDQDARAWHRTRKHEIVMFSEDTGAEGGEA